MRKNRLLLGAYYLAVYAPYAIMKLAFSREVSTLQCAGCVAIISGPILGVWFVFFGNQMPYLEEARSKSACAVCEYDLTGNTSGICPECGTTIPKEMREKLTADPPKR